MHRSAFVLALIVGGCGPSAGDPSADSNGDSSAATVSDDSSTGASPTSGDSDPETTSDTTSAEAESSSTGAPDDELPPEAAGNWLCTGFEDPIYVRLAIDEAGQWTGTACGPNSAPLEPAEWTNCGELQGHFNPFGTQAYWAFELPYEDFGVRPILFEFGFGYVAESDTLEGQLYVSTLQGLVPETCMREPD